MADKEKKYFKTGIIKEFQPDSPNGTFSGYASTTTIDSHNHIVLPEAFKETLPNYMKNPVVLAGHKIYATPEGKAPVIGKIIEAKIDNHGLWVRGEFAPTELGQEYRKLVEGGFLSGMSIQFSPIDWQDARSEDGNNLSVRVFKEIELLEISIVTLPANKEALITAKQKHLINDQVLQGLLNSQPDESQKSKGGIGNLTKQITGLTKQLQMIKETMARRDDIEQAIDNLKAELLDSDTYARALMGYAGDDGSGRLDSPDVELQSLAEITAKIAENKQ